MHNVDAMDFETTPKFNLVLEGKDNNNELANINVTINLNDVNPPTTGLVLYMPFDGNVNDLSINNNNGIDYTSQNYVTGKKSQSLDFNGISDYSKINQHNKFSKWAVIPFWMYTRGSTGTDNNGSVVSKYSKEQQYQMFYGLFVRIRHI